MAGYTGRYQGSAGKTSAYKVARADSGPRRTVNEKIAMVEDYIKNEARRRFNGDLDQVPCPDVRIWNQLASGHTPTLPSTAQMGLFSTQELRDLGTELGHLRLAYFAVALENLKGSTQR